MRGNWFSSLFGFVEEYSIVKKNIILEGNKLVSSANGRSFEAGQFSTPSVTELRNQVKQLNTSGGNERKLKLKYIAVSDIYETHKNEIYKGAMFQVASQFNCLEFVSGNVIPEIGITGYASDHTQGPACSLACPAATLYRNYFVPTTKGNIGQSKDDQINNLDEIEKAVGNENNNFWISRNGYTNSSEQKLKRFNNLVNEGKFNRDELISIMKIGLHKNIEVISTFEDQKVIQIVNQAFCSGISISYSFASQYDWEYIAKIVLDGAYEATLLATVLQSFSENGSNTVVLTFIGGGVFGNDMAWIIDAIARASAIVSIYDLNVEIAFYKRIDTHISKQIDTAFEKYLELFSENPAKNPLNQ